MAYLYETATWRSIVRATRDPKMLAIFSVVTTGGAYLIAKGSQVLTDPMAEERKAELEKKLKRDYESARYANHSKRALGVMFDSIQNKPQKEEVDEMRRIKLPGVMWHPKVAKKDKEKELKAKKEIGQRPVETANKGNDQQ